MDILFVICNSYERFHSLLLSLAWNFKSGLVY